MAGEAKRTKVEIQKEESGFLRGGIKDELAADSAKFTKADVGLLKFHGIYQQDDRDSRKGGRSGVAKSERTHSFMVRTRVPGGVLTADQLLTELDLGDRYGNGTLRITTRQGLQLHGVLKGDLTATIREINETLITTLSACGDVARNTMCCPAPHHHDPLRQRMQATAQQIAAHLSPRTSAYHEIWLDGEKAVSSPASEDEEPIYGKTYLPRKFKTGITLPEDNCIDIHTHDLGFLGIVEDGELVGYNVLLGGGMGRTPQVENTYPRLATPFAYVAYDDVLAVTEAIVKVQRDYGNRSNRKRARLKYLLDERGDAWFKAKVEEYLGNGTLAAPKPVEVTGYDDHLGWHSQGDGKFYFGLPVENGRIQDTNGVRLKTGLRQVLNQLQPAVRLTAQQSVLLCDLEESARDQLLGILRQHGIPTVEEISLVRRHSMACPALPTCGLALAESERVMPAMIDALEGELVRLGLETEEFTMRMTGCPNACARPYNCDIGIVGKVPGEYTVFLGGAILGNRLNFIYKDRVLQEDVVAELVPLFAFFKSERQPGETFGDFCDRQGVEALVRYAEAHASVPA